MAAQFYRLLFIYVDDTTSHVDMGPVSVPLRTPTPTLQSKAWRQMAFRNRYAADRFIV